MLQAILNLLRKYESEIVNLQRLYTLLRKRQLGLSDLIKTDPSHIGNTKSEYLSIAKSMKRTIERSDIRVDALNHEIRGQAMELVHGDKPG